MCLLKKQLLQCNVLYFLQEVILMLVVELDQCMFVALRFWQCWSKECPLLETHEK